MQYSDFLKRKQIKTMASGFDAANINYAKKRPIPWATKKGKTAS